VSITVSREEIKTYQKLMIISQIAPIKERIRFFEEKYGSAFEALGSKIKQEKEDFEKWDDYVEWKAYIESLKDLETKLKKIESAKNIRIT